MIAIALQPSAPSWAQSASSLVVTQLAGPLRIVRLPAPKRLECGREDLEDPLPVAPGCAVGLGKRR